MDGKQYCYLGSSPLTIPWWTEVVKWIHQEGVERVDAPMLFSTLEGAGEQLRALHGAAADEYLRLVEQHGEEEVNEAYENTPPHEDVLSGRGDIVRPLGRLGLLVRPGRRSDDTPSGLRSRS
jgi:hypothetical protein